METVPVIVFTYARPDLLRQTIGCLRADAVPLLYAFSDGPRTPAADRDVIEVRDLLRAIDWCDVVTVFHESNSGLGRSILQGVASVLERHTAALVFEDDLVCVPGTYRYLCAALNRYADEPTVMSVSGWTHPSVIPPGVTDLPYFDGRAESWVWGTWQRAWRGMEADAMTQVRACRGRGIDIHRYGTDLLPMAQVELASNIWAVRWLYHHIAHGGLCLRPPYSMVDHIGFDGRASNAADGTQWASPTLQPCPPIPAEWPEPIENLHCAGLWRKAVSRRSKIAASLRRKARRVLHWLRK